jgi:hypothetical protein
MVDNPMAEVISEGRMRGSAGVAPTPRLGLADRFVARLLFVTPRPTTANPAPDQLLGFAVLVAGLRCILRYAVLPFGLPLLGMAAGDARAITLACDIVAVVAAITSLRRMWAVQSPQRWRYLMITCGVLAFAGLFLVIDGIPRPA